MCRGRWEDHVRQRPPRRVNEIVLGKRGITADTALRLAAFFGTSEGFWLGLQSDYDLEEARQGIRKELVGIEEARAKYTAEMRIRLTDAQRSELDHRLADDDAFPDDVVSWDEVKISIRARLGR